MMNMKEGKQKAIETDSWHNSAFVLQHIFDSCYVHGGEDTIDFI